MPDPEVGEANGARWRRLEPLFDELCDLTGELRVVRLAEIRAGDPAAADELADLLAASESEAFPVRPAGDLLSRLSHPDLAPARGGERAGPFLLGEEIGRGGMGTVYAADRVEGGFAQHVAVKVLRRGLDSEDMVRRFLAERALLARLEHPSIARLVDGGLTVDGLPWFAMERVVGRPITVEPEGRVRSLTERLNLFLEVCRAVGFAHQQRIVHRDLKPSNVLVDATGQVKLLDFGIAKILAGDDERSNALTRTHAAPMTPGFAAPEQWEGGPITERTDIWQLGRLLEELVPTERPPGIRRIIAQARDDHPTRRYGEVGELADDVRRFLAGQRVVARSDSRWVRRIVRAKLPRVLVAMIALVALGWALGVFRRGASDLQRASAEPTGPLASAFALLSSAGAAEGQPNLAPDGRQLVFVAEDPRGVPQIWRRAFDGAVPHPLTSGPTPAAHPRWSVDGRIYFERIGEGVWTVSAGGGSPRQLIADGMAPSVSADGRRIAYERLGQGLWVANIDGSAAHRVAVPETWSWSWAYRQAALSPDGRSVVYFQALAGRFGDFWIAEVDADEPPRRLTHDLAEGGSPVWTPDGRGVVASSSRDGARNLWWFGLDGSPPRALTVGSGDDLDPSLSADGRALVYATARDVNVVSLRDPRTGRDRELQVRRSSVLDRPTLSPNGDRVAFYSGHRPGAMRLYTIGADGAGFRQAVEPSVAGADQIHPRWSVDGRTLYYYEDRPSSWIVAEDGSGIRFDADGSRPTFRAAPSAGGPSRTLIDDWSSERQNWTDVDPTGREVVYTLLAGPGQRRRTRIRHLATGIERDFPVTLRRPTWSADGGRILGVLADGRATHCRVDGGDCVNLGPAREAHWAADQAEVYLARPGPSFADPRLVSVEVVATPARGGAERPIALLRPLRRDDDGITVGPDGSLAWIARRQGPRELWSARLELPRAEVPPAPAPTEPLEFRLISTFSGSHRQASLSPDGRRFAFLGDDSQGRPQVFVQTLALEDGADAPEPTQLTKLDPGAHRPRWSPSGDAIYFDVPGRGIWVTTPEGREPRQVFGRGYNVNVSPDGRRLVFEDRVGLWVIGSDGSEPRRVGTIEPELLNKNFPFVESTPAWSPDGQRLVYFQDLPTDPELGDLWEVGVDGSGRRQLTHDGATASGPAWMPDGTALLFTSGRRGGLTLWSLARGAREPRAITTGTGEDTEVDVSRDGRRILYTNARNVLRLMWLDPRTGERRQLLERRAAVTHPSFDPSGERVVFFARDGIGSRDLHLLTLRTDGTDLKALMSPRGRGAVLPEWSSDGRWISFYEMRDPSYRRMPADPANGSIEETLLSGFTFRREHGVHLDGEGRRAVYTRFAPPGAEIIDSRYAPVTLVRDLATGLERPLGATILWPRWSPDGKLVAGLEQSRTTEGPRAANLLLCPADGGACRRVGRGTEPRWTPDGTLYYARYEGYMGSRDPRFVGIWRLRPGNPTEEHVVDLPGASSINFFYDVSLRGEIVWCEFVAGRRELWTAELAPRP